MLVDEGRGLGEGLEEAEVEAEEVVVEEVVEEEEEAAALIILIKLSNRRWRAVQTTPGSPSLMLLRCAIFSDNSKRRSSRIAAQFPMP